MMQTIKDYNFVGQYIQLSNRFGTYYMRVTKQYEILLVGPMLRDIPECYRKGLMRTSKIKEGTVFLNSENIPTIRFIDEETFNKKEKELW